MEPKNLGIIRNTSVTVVSMNLRGKLKSLLSVSKMLICVSGLLSLMYIETIALVLEVTDKSNSAPLSFSRYLSTLNHTLAWYRSVQTFSLIFLMMILNSTQGCS